MILGGCCHTASSEPYFYDQSYANSKTQKVTISIDDQGKHVVEREIWVREPRNTPIPVDEQGRCVLAQDMGERHPKTHRPPKWKCTSECKLPTKEERQRILDLKSVRTLRRALDAVDSGCQNGHYTCSAPGRDLGDEPMIRDLAGHPLMYTITGCESKLRTLREAAPHHPMLRSFLKTLYEAIRSHKMIASIDSALRTGKFASLALWYGIKDYRKLFSSEHNSNSTDTNCASKPTVDIQRPNLPDVESEFQVKHAQMIAELEKKLANYPKFACCSCERLLQRKSVTAFDFSENKKFTSNKWQVLRAYMVRRQLEAEQRVCLWHVATRSERSCSKSWMSPYALLQMWGSTFGAGASAMLLPSWRRAGLVVEISWSACLMISAWSASLAS